MHAAPEPTPERYPTAVGRCFAATRPAFLGITLLAVSLGFALAWRAGATVDVPTVAVALVFALVAHAAANVINDYHDAQSGCDAANSERIFPFTGGSRFIQNGVLSSGATARLGYGLLASVAMAGLWLTARIGPGLIPIGLAGLFVAWAYSAPPLRLMSRGIGELAIIVGWLLVVCGGDFVLQHRYSVQPVIGGLPVCLQFAAILYLNQIPDARADALAGKHTLIVRLGVRHATPGFLLLTAGGYCALIAAFMAGDLPRLALLALAAAPLHMVAGVILRRHAASPGRLRPAIILTIAAAHLFGLLQIAAVVAA
jgi:1,4-dihydroxy-2-naphthoate octaprenyltransferase